MLNTKKMVYPPHNSSIGNTDARWLLLVAYLGPIVIGWIPEVGGLLSWILPLILLFMEKGSHMVRFSAAQSFMLSVASSIVNFILTILAIVTGVFTFGIGALLMGFISIVFNIAVWVVLAYAAYQGFSKWTAWEMPVIGNWSHRLEQSLGNPQR